MRSLLSSVVASLATGGLAHVSAYSEITSAVADPTTPIYGQPTTAVYGQMPIHGLLLNDCDNSITQCVDKNLKVVREAMHNTTSTVTNWVEEVTTLDTVTETAVSVVIMTSPAQTKGRCEETTTLSQNSTTTIVISVESTSTIEFVPVVTTTSVSTQWVVRDITSQCIVRSTGLPFPPPVVPHPPPPPPPQVSVQVPVYAPSGPSPGAAVREEMPTLVGSAGEHPAATVSGMVEHTHGPEEAHDTLEEEAMHAAHFAGVGHESE